MKYDPQVAPHIRTRDSNATLMTDVIIALVPLYFMAVYYYSWRPVVIGLAAVGTCYATDAICQMLGKRRVNITDLSPIVTGMILSLLMPASVPWHILITACVFAITVAKHPFGGTGHNIFNPAVAGYTFSAICWPAQMFRYPVPHAPLSVLEPAKNLVESPAALLKLGAAVLDLGSMELLLGNFPGQMGPTNILVILTCLLFLIFRGAVNWRVPVSFLATAAAIAYFFPRIPATMGRELSVMYELCSGTLVFGSVFLLADPVTSPKRNGGKIIYGVVSAITAMLFRYYGGFESGLEFSVLILNALVFTIDRFAELCMSFLRRLFRILRLQ